MSKFQRSRSVVDEIPEPRERMEPRRVDALRKADSAPAAVPGGDGGGVPAPSDEPRDHRSRKPSCELRMAELSDFSLQGVLGKGEFGTVMMAIKHDTQKVYAIKVLQKDNIVHRGESPQRRTRERPALSLALADRGPGPSSSPRPWARAPTLTLLPPSAGGRSVDQAVTEKQVLQDTSMDG